MTNALIRTAVGLSVAATMFALTPSAQAQSLGIWSNAKDKNYYLGVSGGVSCDPIGHGSCWLNDGQQLIVWNQLANDQDWWVWPNSTNTVQNATRDRAGNHLCLGVTNGSFSPGANLIVWPCNGNADQTWAVVPASNYNLDAPDCYVFVNKKDGQLMAVAGGTLTNGAHVIQWGASDQHPATLDMAWCP